MAKLTAKRAGLRVPSAWDGFELAMRAVLGQQITVAAAIKLAGKMVAQYGEPLATLDAQHPSLSHVFPTAAILSKANFTGMPQSRANTLSALATDFEADPNLLSSGSNVAETCTKLLAIAGIGDWTTQYIAMRQLREPDAFPASDVALIKAITQLEGPCKLSTRAETWRPWRAYAAQHLWTEVA
ncbi:DNA-3-methyladenine glycosylase family protein [Iodobacter arcticus]|uniref:DNA-3-methyladenine glycosylase II n=1 Tax=Iodobacter arcticus TaxID=590593 RepID=A0ABW2R1E9_9NEIS